MDVERRVRGHPPGADLVLWLNRGGSLRWAGWLALWLALLVGLTLVVHARLLVPLDEAGLGLVAAFRPPALTAVVNWIFRLGFVQVDAAVAVVWAAVLLARQRSLLAALPPLVLFASIGAQAGLRLAVDQPPPGKAYALSRDFAASPVSSILDETDRVARETFAAATTTPGAAAAPGATARGQGTFPSGHATRGLFLALLAIAQFGRPARRRTRLGRRILFAALLALAVFVGYSALYYGYHWPSDVIGGYLLALALYQVAMWMKTAFQGARMTDGIPSITG